MGSGNATRLPDQTLELKSRFIEQVMRGDATIRTMEDLEGNALSYAEVKALASGNPKVARKVIVDTEVRRLAMLKSRWEGSLRDMEMEVTILPQRITKLQNALQAHKRDLEKRGDITGENFTCRINGVDYTDREAAGQEILKLYPMIILRAMHLEVVTIGEFAGFEFGIMREGGDANLVVRGEKTYSIEIKVKTPHGAANLLERLVASLEQHIAGTEMQIDEVMKRLTELRMQLASRVWEHDDKYRALQAEQAALISELELDKTSDKSTSALDAAA